MLETVAEETIHGNKILDRQKAKGEEPLCFVVTTLLHTISMIESVEE